MPRDYKPIPVARDKIYLYQLFLELKHIQKGLNNIIDFLATHEPWRADKNTSKKPANAGK